ncbi:acetoacetyl-CoA reductase [Corallococcus aberystwythensis]|uniref:Acetoacetyl-CoA reductase n=1 Tax=Corallococcus aberystwythensis TaxID=2316722 RepID=A0A3A8Q2M6_9BACT|nr:acetoacetyl-CoA reductase [Corallococcus aberystwythensis]RKH57594.1 acetoacetyl-CoA reductase [Corallococcus aberystwythensis]
MSGRVAVVTGGTRGIGAASADALRQQGYRVAVTYNANEQAAQAFTSRTGIPAFRFDAASAEQCAAGVQKIVDSIGPIEVLVNNAGITRDAMLHKMTHDQWNEVIQTNLSSCFNLCVAVVGPMRERGFGRIINIGSINGQTGQLGQTAYAAAKAGMHGFTLALAREGAARGVTANLIAPGYIDTDLLHAVPPDELVKIRARIPVGRLGRSDEIARAVTFLASDRAGFITGSTLTINGGQHMY